MLSDEHEAKDEVEWRPVQALWENDYEIVNCVGALRLRVWFLKCRSYYPEMSSDCVRLDEGFVSQEMLHRLACAAVDVGSREDSQDAVECLTKSKKRFQEAIVCGRSVEEECCVRT